MPVQRYLVNTLKGIEVVNLHFLMDKTQVQFLRSSTLGFQLNSNTLTKNILRKDNIVCVSLVNAIMCLNSIKELNVSNLRNYN